MVKNRVHVIQVAEVNKENGTEEIQEEISHPESGQDICCQSVRCTFENWLLLIII